MSHSHIRAVVPKKSDVTPLWLKLFVGLCVALLAAIPILFVAHPYPDRGPMGGYRTAEGKILETRIVIDHAEDFKSGGRIFYRAEARVLFEQNGKPQDRWLVVLRPTVDRGLLAVRLSANPQTCQVYWAPDFPENPRCRLE
jgi:hypothetical protein